MHIKPSIGLNAKKFSKNIIGKHSTFAVHKPPRVFRKRISALLGKINFVYVFPLMIIRRNIQLSKKTRIIAPIRKAWNILNIRFEYKFPLSWHMIPSFNMSSSRIFVTQVSVPPREPLSPEVSKFQTISSIIYPTRTQVDRLLDLTFKLKTHSSSKTAPEKQINWFSEKTLLHGPPLISFHLLKIIHAELRVPESLARERTFSVMPPALLHEKPTISKAVAPATLGTSPRTEHAYPLIEHIVRVSPTIVRETKERIVKKEIVSESQSKAPVLDVNRLADQIYQLLERKVRIERERRGL